MTKAEIKKILFKRRGRHVGELRNQRKKIESTMTEIREEIDRATVNGEDNWMVIRDRRKKPRKVQSGSNINTVCTDSGS